MCQYPVSSDSCVHMTAKIDIFSLTISKIFLISKKFLYINIHTHTRTHTRARIEHIEKILYFSQLIKNI